MPPRRRALARAAPDSSGGAGDKGPKYMKDYTREAVGRQLGAMRCRRCEFMFRREKTGEVEWTRPLTAAEAMAKIPLMKSRNADGWHIYDNSFEHSISYTFRQPDGTPDGSIKIYAMPTNPDTQDSFNCNFAIADEVAAYKKPAQYNRFKEAQAS